VCNPIRPEVMPATVRCVHKVLYSLGFTLIRKEKHAQVNTAINSDLHVTSQYVVELTKARPVSTTECVCNGRETKSTMSQDVRVNGRHSGRLNHADVMTEQVFRNN